MSTRAIQWANTNIGNDHVGQCRLGRYQLWGNTNIKNDQTGQSKKVGEPATPAVTPQNKAKRSVQYTGWDSTSVLSNAGRSVQNNGWDSTVIRSEYTQQSRVVSTVQWMGQLIRSECTQQSREVSRVQWMGQHCYQEHEQYCGLDTTIIRSKHAQQSTFNGCDTFTRSKCAGHTIITNKAGTGMAVLWVEHTIITSVSAQQGRYRHGSTVGGTHHHHQCKCSTRQAQAWQYCGWNTPSSPV